MTDPLRVMAVMAHQDDFELNVAGAFALLRRHYGDAVSFRILCTSRGATGHYALSLDETFARRDAEARASAALIGGEYECLTCLDGSHVATQVMPDHNFLGGLWNAIRHFEPHYIFTHPIVDDPFAGVHIDHLHTAQAVRLVAYQLGVPFAYPTMNGDVKLRVTAPVVINVHDPYADTSRYDVVVDWSSVFDTKRDMILCHRSQVLEWLPFTGGHEPLTADEYRASFADRMRQRTRGYGYTAEGIHEFFRFTRWARRPVRDDIARVFPTGRPSAVCLEQLGA